jgi:KDO2-lipid IV(A) lauroyltransferase
MRFTLPALFLVMAILKRDQIITGTKWLISPLRRLWHLVEYSVAAAVFMLICLIPLPLVLSFAGGIARLIFFCWRTRRNIAMDNLLQSKICASPTQARSLALAAFRNFTFRVVESIVARRRITSKNWDQHVKLRLSPEAERLLREPGRGIVVASAHIGNWEVAAHAASHFKPMCVIYRPLNNPYLERASHARRSGENIRFVSRNERSPMRFLEALVRGEILALMIDQTVISDRVAVDFFGRSAWTTTAVAMMHLTTRAPLIAAFAVRTGPLRYEVRAVGPIVCPRSGNREKDVFEITQALTREIEKIVREFPEQYLWGHKRWQQ